MKKATLVTALQDRALMWYINYYTDNLIAMLVDIQTALNKEFGRPKSEAQSIFGFKEIMMKLGETPWELDQRLKCKICEANMNLMDGQHCEWFVASLLPHLRVSLSQQKIGTQTKAMDIAMRLHETTIQDAALGVQQIHAELQNPCLEFQSLKKDKVARPEVHKEVWCLKCKSQRHDKDHFPIFANYVPGGWPVPLRLESQAGTRMGPTLWCVICWVAGKHVTDNCHLLQKFVQTLQQLFCNFYKSMGHDECNYRSYELMMERAPAYRMQTETQSPDQGIGGARGGYQGQG